MTTLTTHITNRNSLVLGVGRGQQHGTHTHTQRAIHLFGGHSKAAKGEPRRPRSKKRPQSRCLSFSLSLLSTPLSFLAHPHIISFHRRPSHAHLSRSRVHTRFATDPGVGPDWQTTGDEPLRSIFAATPLIRRPFVLIHGLFNPPHSIGHGPSSYAVARFQRSAVVIVFPI